MIWEAAVRKVLQCEQEWHRSNTHTSCTACKAPVSFSYFQWPSVLRGSLEQLQSKVETFSLPFTHDAKRQTASDEYDVTRLHVHELQKFQI